jgi:hypothetical protein
MKTVLVITLNPLKLADIPEYMRGCDCCGSFKDPDEFDNKFCKECVELSYKEFNKKKQETESIKATKEYKELYNIIKLDSFKKEHTVSVTELINLINKCKKLLKVDNVIVR